MAQARATLAASPLTGWRTTSFEQAGTTGELALGSADDGAPYIGEHSTAIAPYPQVLDDLGRITGCVMDWGLAGYATWWPDQWWPVITGSQQTSTRADLDATYLRGKAQYSGRKPNEQGVKVHARTPDGLHEYTAQFPASMTGAMQRIELDGLVATSADTVTKLAQTQYYKAGLHYTAGPQELTFTLKGPGEWLRPDQWLSLACHNTTGETVIRSGHAAGYDVVGWITENVTWEWGRQDAFRTWSATAKCRRFWR